MEVRLADVSETWEGEKLICGDRKNWEMLWGDQELGSREMGSLELSPVIGIFCGGRRRFRR